MWILAITGGAGVIVTSLVLGVLADRIRRISDRLGGIPPPGRPSILTMLVLPRVAWGFDDDERPGFDFWEYVRNLSRHPGAEDLARILKVSEKLLNIRAICALIAGPAFIIAGFCTPHFWSRSG